jgi:hypothetical protein
MLLRRKLGLADLEPVGRRELQPDIAFATDELGEWPAQIALRPILGSLGKGSRGAASYPHHNVGNSFVLVHLVPSRARRRDI